MLADLLRDLQAFAASVLKDRLVRAIAVALIVAVITNVAVAAGPSDFQASLQAFVSFYSLMVLIVLGGVVWGMTIRVVRMGRLPHELRGVASRDVDIADRVVGALDESPLNPDRDPAQDA